jgi:hypothetical protein
MGRGVNMILIDFEERLIALNSEANAGYVDQGGEWRQIAPEFARKAYFEGDELTAEQARTRYPNAALQELLALARLTPSDR